MHFPHSVLAPAAGIIAIPELAMGGFANGRLFRGILTPEPNFPEIGAAGAADGTATGVGLGKSFGFSSLFPDCCIFWNISRKLPSFLKDAILADVHTTTAQAQRKFVNYWIQTIITLRQTFPKPLKHHILTEASSRENAKTPAHRLAFRLSPGVRIIVAWYRTGRSEDLVTRRRRGKTMHHNLL